MIMHKQFVHELLGQPSYKIQQVFESEPLNRIDHGNAKTTVLKPLFVEFSKGEDLPCNEVLIIFY